MQSVRAVAITLYDTARFLVEPISARDVLAPEELAQDTLACQRAHKAFTSAAGVPQNGGATLLEESLSVLGGAPVARTLDALDAMSVLPASRFTSKLKAVAALAAARLYAAESMSYRSAGSGIDWVAGREGGATLQDAMRALPVEFVVTRRYAYENLSDATDRLLGELRAANPYLRVIIRDSRPRAAADRKTIAQTVLDRCGGGTGGLSLGALSDAHFPALVGRHAGDPETARPDWVLGQEQMAAESAKLLAARVLTLLRAIDEPLPDDAMEELLDFIIQVYALDSSVVRTVQLLKRRGIEKAKVQCDLTSLHAAEATVAIRNTGRRLLRRYTSASAARDLVSGMSIVSGRDLDGTSERVVAHYIEAGLERN